MQPAEVASAEKSPVPSESQPLLDRPQVLSPFTQRIAADLSANLIEGAFLSERNLLAVKTFTAVNDPACARPFGRALTDCLAASLQQQGYLLAEMEASPPLVKDMAGQDSALARETDIITERLDLQALVTGTYAVAFDRVLVNARLVDILDGTVVSTSAQEIPVDKNMARLFSDEIPTSASVREPHELSSPEAHRCRPAPSMQVPVFERMPHEP